MKFFLESIKRSFKEIAGRWWFLFAFLSMHMIGILTSLVGIFMMFVTGSDAYSGINYGWAVHMLGSIVSMPRALEQSAVTAIPWVLQRSFLLLVLYFLAYYSLGVVPSNARNDSSIRKILRNTATVFFAVNVVATIVAAVIVAYVTHDVFGPYLSSLGYFVSPISFLNYVLIGALLNAKGSECYNKIVLRLIAFMYLLLVVEEVANKFIIRCFPARNATVVVVRQPMFTADTSIIINFIFSFLLFAFSLFAYAYIIDNERFLPSVSKGVIFTLKHLQYALILGFVVYLFRDLSIYYIGMNLLHLPWPSRYDYYMEKFVPILHEYLRIVAVIIAFNFYRLKKVT